MSTPAVLLDGTWVDNFRIVRRLGRGGFGVTYLAEEFREWEHGEGERETTSPLRQVVLKEFFPRGLADRVEGNTVAVSTDLEGAEQGFQMALKGFYQEAEALMRFDHPNVIKIYRVFRRNGTAYFVMPYLQGESMKLLLKREGALSEARARALLMPVLDGLTHAHALGILHRDLKPDNIMTAEEGSPVLIDFGAARAQVLDGSAEYTRQSELVAYSPGYAALEQYGRASRDNPHGPQTDVYGMAAVLYHAVVGEPPVEASQRSMQITNGADDPLLPASERLQGAKGCSAAFLAAIDWALELASRNRPQTLSVFRAALDGEVSVPEQTRMRLAALGVEGAADIAPPAEVTAQASVRVGAAERARPRLDAPQGAIAPEISVPARPRSRRRSRLLPLMLLLALCALAWMFGREQIEQGLQEHLPQTVIERLPPQLVAFFSLNPASAGNAEAETHAGPESEPLAGQPVPSESEMMRAEAKVSVDEGVREAYEAARQVNSVQAWQAFKDAFPDSPLVAAASIRIAALTAQTKVDKPARPEQKSVARLEPAAPKAAPPQSMRSVAPARAAAVEPPLSRGGVRDCSGCPEMVSIRGGSFRMGDVSGTGEADELPLRTVNIKPFYAGRYEVTFDEWNRCVRSGACPAAESDAGWGEGRRPVINVSWNDAHRFTRWLSRQSGKSYRLPSEAEFEYLNRAGSEAAYPWGNDGASACTYANVADAQAKRRKPKWSTFACDDGNPYTATVGSYRSNAFGLFDVSGNVWEWTQDCYASYRNAPTDGAAHNPRNCARRVVRGGSWSDARRNLRSADRTASAPTARLNIVGLRVVREP